MEYWGFKKQVSIYSAGVIACVAPPKRRVQTQGAAAILKF